MDYPIESQPRDDAKMKKIVIGVSIALVVLGAAAFAVILARRSGLEPSEPLPSIDEQPGATLPGEVSGATGASELPSNVIVGLAAPGSLPKGATEETKETVYAPGLNRPMTVEEKASYGWSAEADVWIRTTRGSGGQTSVEIYNPTAPLPPPDADADGLSDADEAKYGTDPKNPDADGDLLLDGIEIRIGSDPKKADTNGDGVSDFLEFERNGKISVDGDGDVSVTGQ